MDLIEFFEYPLPKIEVDVDKVAINTNDKNSGVINIKNIGGGILSGDIVSNTDCIILDTETFEGNNISISYTVVPSIYYGGDFIKSEITIQSNGGQVYIPVYINISNFNYLECNNEKIYSIKDFYGLYLKNHIEATRLFYSYEFMIWLKNINYKHIDIVEELLKDATKQRAIDNFFILNKLKEKAYIKLKQTHFKYKYYTVDKDEEIVGVIPIELVGVGYFEEDICLECDTDFLSLSKNKITNRDFQNNTYNLEFKIYKNKITKPFERKKIIFNNSKNNVIIEINKKNPVEIIMDKEYYTQNDTGVIKIFNNTDKDIVVEIIPKDTFVFFNAKKYSVSKYLEINFSIKLSSFIKAQMDFTKTPNIESEILIKASHNSNIYKFQKNIYIGNSLI